MICYKDQTFCAERCGNMDCFRQYTDRDRERNVDDLPIAWANLRTDDCGYVEPDGLPEPEGEWISELQQEAGEWGSKLSLMIKHSQKIWDDPGIVDKTTFGEVLDACGVKHDNVP